MAPARGPVDRARARVRVVVAARLPQKKGNGAVIAVVFGGIVALGAAAAGTFFI
jgi:hypothetical protein